ncbi:unnamed protein product [Urochloa decumbens]|uniref:Uncharacterized protein n=1 Tax=Urochloa decumbens TaxID=240449 RepID=A0ABC8WFR5_9POAL
MGRKGKWFDAVQRILSTSEPDPPEADAKAAKQRDKPSFKKIWQFGRSNSSGASTSAAAAPNPEAHQPQPPQPDQHQAKETAAEAQPEETTRSPDVASKQAGADAAAAVARPTAATPREWLARSKEDIAATRIQAACRGYLARRGHQERGMARLMSLVEGFTIKRQTEEALYCMQTMTRIQTQIYSRRLKTEEDKKALKGRIKVEQSLDKSKIGEGWDHSLQSKEQMEAMMMMKQEAASRRQRAMSYAFSNQWRNRNPSSARAAPAPMFMDPGNPNWGWSWTERWMAAARPWENQTAALETGRRAGATAKSAGRMPRLAVSIQIPTTTTTPRGKSLRPPNWPSIPSPSTPPPRSQSLSARTAAVASPRSGTLHASSSGLHPDRLPRSSQELSAAASSPRRAVAASPRGGGSPLHPSGGGMHPDRNRRPRSSQELSVSSPRRAMPASPRGGGAGSPLHASGGVQRAASMRPRSSQEHAASSPRHGGKDAPAPLRRTTSLRAELPRRLILGSAAAAGGTAVPAGDDEGSPVTPSYMQPTRSVKAKARCASPSASAAADTFSDAPESGLAPLRVPSPSSAKKRVSLAFADKPSASSPSKAAAERVMRRHSQPPSPRMSQA